MAKPPAGYDPRQDIAAVLFDRTAIRRRVRQLARAISRDYAPRAQADPTWNLLLVSVLRGAVFFVSDLARNMEIPVTIDFMAVLPYAGHPGKVRIVKDLEEDLLGRDVLVVEDIIDTGLTLRYILDILASRRPRSLKVVSLIDRPSLRLVNNLPVAYTGFTLDDTFVVGYGLDYRERYRELPFIGVLKDEVFER